MARIFIVLAILSLLLQCISSLPADRIKAVIEKAKKELWNEQLNGTYWLYPAYLGTNFISEYYVVNHLVGHENETELSGTLLRSMLLEAQLHDGSWKQVPEDNKPSGEIDTTIFNYWALKVLGEDADKSQVMQKARQFILKSGGLDAAQTMTKFWLAMFGNYQWSSLGYIPLIVFHREGILSWLYAKNFIAQWVWPHLIPMAYARATHLTKDLGNKFSLHELNAKGATSHRDLSFWDPSKGELETLVERMLEIQQPLGSFGTYTVSSLFSIVCLQDFLTKYPDTSYAQKIKTAIKKAFNFIEMLYLKTGSGAYKGVLDDGRFWDTALVALSLAEAKEDGEKFASTIKYFADYQQPNGGIPYGLEFEYAPDTDDTALAVTFMCKIGHKEHPTVKRALAWLKSMQNSDGGFAAFDRNRGGNWFLSYLAGVFTNSAEAFDPSCVDLTGHILEAFGTCGITLANDKDGFLKKAVDYIKNEQTDFGAWEARWGINYIYAVGSAISGMKKIGVDFWESWIAKSIYWLATKQNPDGGFGESSLSYVNKDWIGKGVSTPSQTAWALLAFLELRHTYYFESEIEKAMEYLISQYEAKGTWIDKTSVGTGHRKILYMQYPAYSHTFPLIALARYLKL